MLFDRERSCSVHVRPGATLLFGIYHLNIQLLCSSDWGMEGSCVEGFIEKEGLWNILLLKTITLLIQEGKTANMKRSSLKYFSNSSNLAPHIWLRGMFSCGVIDNISTFLKILYLVSKNREHTDADTQLEGIIRTSNVCSLNAHKTYIKEHTLKSLVCSLWSLGEYLGSTVRMLTFSP